MRSTHKHPSFAYFPVSGGLEQFKLQKSTVWVLPAMATMRACLHQVRTPHKIQQHEAHIVDCFYQRVINSIEGLLRVLKQCECFQKVPLFHCFPPLLVQGQACCEQAPLVISQPHGLTSLQSSQTIPIKHSFLIHVMHDSPCTRDPALISTLL
jgi:hypothetical protein